jgi:hypothetical protein
VTTTRVSGGDVDSNADGKTTQAITTGAVGDLVTLVIQTSSTTNYFASVTSTYINWSFGRLGLIQAVGGAEVMGLTWFAGIVTAAGQADTIVGTPAAAIGTVNSQWTGSQFHTDIAGATWALDGTPATATSGTGTATTMDFPTLTSAGSGRLYVGCAVPTNVGSAGSTSGFTYVIDGYTSVYAYDLAVGSGSITTTAPAAPAGQWVSVGGLFVPVTAGAPPKPSTAPRTPVHRAALL